MPAPPQSSSKMPPAPVNMSEVNSRLAEAISEQIGTVRYRMWFGSHIRFVHLGTDLIVCTPSGHFQEWLQQTFDKTIRSAASSVLGAWVNVRYEIDPELFKATRPDEEPPQPTAKPTAKPAPALPLGTTDTKHSGDRAATAKTESAPPSPISRAGRRWHHLKDFVVGPCNRVAFASAQSVVEEPGLGANPLVIHGPVGTGKTHLLEGIVSGLRKSRPDLRVHYVTAEEFMNRFVATMRSGKMIGFRKTFRECGALLVDDLNFLAKKKASQEEFLHTLDALVSDGRQVVVTMDCHPRLCEDLRPELIDRLLGGAIWGLLPPDQETRLAILRAKTAGVTPMIPEDVLHFLARQLRGNIRELEGAVNSVRHYAKVTNRRIDLSLAREALADLLRHAVKVVGVPEVDAAVCAVLKLPSGHLQSKQRSWAVSHPRMLAIWLCRKHTAASFSEISLHFGAKTHSTAVAAEKRVREWLAADEKLTLGEREWRVSDLLERIEHVLLG